MTPHLHDLYNAAQAILADPAHAEKAVTEAYRRVPDCADRKVLFKVLLAIIRKQSWLSGGRRANTGMRDRQMAVALTLLPPDCRVALVLQSSHEFSTADVAEILGISYEQAGETLRRGWALLEAHLALKVAAAQ